LAIVDDFKKISLIVGVQALQDLQAGLALQHDCLFMAERLKQIGIHQHYALFYRRL
jgi:hypothetical protein